MDDALLWAKVGPGGLCVDLGRSAAAQRAVGGLEKRSTRDGHAERRRNACPTRPLAVRPGHCRHARQWPGVRPYPGAWRRGALEPLPNPPWWCYNNAMTLTARVQNGRYVIDERPQLPEGAEVTLQVIDGDDLDDEERAQLHAALEEASDDIDAGRVISAEESLKRLRALRCDASK